MTTRTALYSQRKFERWLSIFSIVSIVIVVRIVNRQLLVRSNGKEVMKRPCQMRGQHQKQLAGIALGWKLGLQRHAARALVA
jgi:hypothetical protein